MKFEEIEKLVVKKQPIPKHSSLEEQYCYACIETIYRKFYGKLISKEEAKTSRKQLKQSFLSAQETHRRYTAILAQYQEFIRLAGTFRPQILKALEKRTEPTAIIYLMIRCIGSMCQDQVFEQAARRLLEEGIL